MMQLVASQEDEGMDAGWRERKREKLYLHTPRKGHVRT